MSQYTNNIHVAVNDQKTEVFINFSLLSIDPDNNQITTPVSSVVMSGDMANQLVKIISELMQK